MRRIYSCLFIAALSATAACDTEESPGDGKDMTSDPQTETDAGAEEMPVEIPERPRDLAGCGSQEDDVVGSVVRASADPADTRLTEISGLAVSRKQPIVWVHDDSGNEPNLYALSLGNEGIADGTPLAIFRLPAVAIRDWEDMAIGPGPRAGVDHIYLGDIGDKNREALESDIVIYRFAEPVVDIPVPPLEPNAEPTTSVIPEIESLRANYPEGQVENADALFVDVLGGRAPDLYVITSGNGISTPNRLFRMKSNAPTETVALEFVEPLFGGESGDPEVTGADMSPDGKMIVVRTLRSATIWTRARDASVDSAFASAPCDALIPGDDADSEEGGAIGFAADSRGYYTSIEGDPAPLWYVSLSAD